MADRIHEIETDEPASRDGAGMAAAEPGHPEADMQEPVEGVEPASGAFPPGSDSRGLASRLPAALSTEFPMGETFGRNGSVGPAGRGPQAAAAARHGPDPFDPAALRLSADPAAGLGVKKALLAVPVRKPDKAWFVRAHPDPGYRLDTAVIELKEDRGGETYLVAPSLWPDLAGEGTFAPRSLVTAVTRQGVVFLWPLRMPGPDGRVDPWARSAREAADLATRGWARVQANMSLGAYDVFQAHGRLADPEWPDVPFADLLRVAFRDHYVDAPDHPVLRKLRGEV